MTILLIEDENGEAKLLERALSRSGLTNPVLHITSPEDALVWLDDCGTAVLPRLILLDLAFPGRMDGLAFLERLRLAPHTRSIPVIVLTAHMEDRIEAYGLGVNGFVAKPINAEKLLQVLRDIGLKWSIVS